jgi:HK97 gp10 family phage protein
MKIGEIREGKKGKYIVVGILRGDNSDQFYLKFAEYGSVKQLKTPFMRPALISNEAKLEAMYFDMILKSAEEIWGG